MSRIVLLGPHHSGKNRAAVALGEKYPFQAVHYTYDRKSPIRPNTIVMVTELPEGVEYDLLIDMDSPAFRPFNPNYPGYKDPGQRPDFGLVFFDKTTKFTGYVTGICRYIDGEKQVQLSPDCRNGHIAEPQWFNAKRLVWKELPSLEDWTPDIEIQNTFPTIEQLLGKQ